MKNIEQNTLSTNGAVTYTKIVTKPCGEQVKLVARYCPNPFISSDILNTHVDVYKKEGEQWVLCKARFEGDKTVKGVEHYIKNQRPETLIVSGGPGLLIKPSQEFQELLRAPQNLFKHIKEKLHSFDNGRYNIEFDYTPA